MADILNNLNSANYITVKVTDNAIANGNNLLAAYVEAKTKTPNGAALSASNRLAVILPPAIYDLGTQSLILDTQYIDIIGSTNDREKHHIKSNIGVNSRGTVQQTANDVRIFNLKIENTNTTYSFGVPASITPAAYYPNNNLNLTYVENVKFLANSTNTISMRAQVQYSGTFINCVSERFGFGYLAASSGIFKDCISGNDSFGYDNYASGTFTNCTGGNNSFGGFGNASGLFINCTGGSNSFKNSNGTFINCTSGSNSFKSDLINDTSSFINCSGGINSFNL